MYFCPISDTQLTLFTSARTFYCIKSVRTKLNRTVNQTVNVFSGSSGQTGVAASETAAQQLKSHEEELLIQETGDDCREEQSGGRQEQVNQDVFQVQFNACCLCWIESVCFYVNM